MTEEEFYEKYPVREWTDKDVPEVICVDHYPPTFQFWERTPFKDVLNAIKDAAELMTGPDTFGLYNWGSLVEDGMSYDAKKVRWPGKVLFEVRVVKYLVQVGKMIE